MSTPATQAALLAQAKAKLARTRQALLTQMRRHAPAPQDRDAADAGKAQDGLWQTLHRWWQDHPANLVLSLARPALQACALAYPGRTLILAAGAGAALVLLRPWRLLPLTALAVAAARSMPLADLLAMWRAQAERSAQAQGKADHTSTSASTPTM